MGSGHPIPLSSPSPKNPPSIPITSSFCVEVTNPEPAVPPICRSVQVDNIDFDLEDSPFRETGVSSTEPRMTLSLECLKLCKRSNQTADLSSSETCPGVSSKVVCARCIFELVPAFGWGRGSVSPASRIGSDLRGRLRGVEGETCKCLGYWGWRGGMVCSGVSSTLSDMVNLRSSNFGQFGGRFRVLSGTTSSRSLRLFG